LIVTLRRSHDDVIFVNQLIKAGSRNVSSGEVENQNKTLFLPLIY
jgi:hypothetical protein